MDLFLILIILRLLFILGFSQCFLVATGRSPLILGVALFRIAHHLIEWIAISASV